MPEPLMSACDRSLGVVVTMHFPIPVVSGGRKRTARLLDAIQRAGVTPHVLTPDQPSDEALAEASARGWSVDAVTRPLSRSRVRRHLRGEVSPFSRELVERLRALRHAAAFVELEEIGAAQYARYAPADVPVIASLHNVDSKARDLTGGDAERRLARARGGYRRSRMAGVERRCVRRATATLAVSEADAAHFRSVGGRRVLLVPNGVDPELFELPIGGGAPDTVLFFGQLCYRPNLEGITRFIRRSWPAVIARHPDACLRIAGPSAPDGLRELAAATDGVELLGFVDDLGAELRRSAAVVVPIWQGGGTRIKVLEALAAARPVVGTSLGVEQVGFADGEHGLVADSDEALAEALCAVLAEPAAGGAYAARGRELARAYAWRRATEPAEALYRELAASQRAPARVSAPETIGASAA